MPEKGVVSQPGVFYKMSGSGNDFVFFVAAGLTAPEAALRQLENAAVIQEICARGTGVGADGVVFLRPQGGNAVAIRYYNSDGSLGELCGNATLCTVRLAVELGLVEGGELDIATDAGMVRARVMGGIPEIDLAPVNEVDPALPGFERLPREIALGFARAGVPHVVILDEDVESAAVLERGSRIRRDPSLRDGANVNFVSRDAAGAWRIRTYERGVEEETLACGTGAVAAGILLMEWEQASSPVRLRTRSGRELEVTARRADNVWYPSLRGSAEVVFIGQLREVWKASQAVKHDN